VHDDLAVRVSLEHGALVGQALAESLVVVDLAVDSERELAVNRDKGLGSRVC